jgi:sugar/nucleoside kinase (ribokinase family)
MTALSKRASDRYSPGVRPRSGPAPLSPDVLVLGTLCEDLFPSFAGAPQLRPGALFEIGALRAQPGGCVANTGFALADLGTSTALGADVGDDAIGDLLLHHIEQRGADAAAVRRVPGRSTSYSVVVEGVGDRCIWHHPGANACFDGEAARALRPGVLHLGYPSLLDALARDHAAALVGLFAAARSHGTTTSLDLAVVEESSPMRGVAWTAWLTRVLPCTDVFAPSRDDLGSIGMADDRDGVAGLARRLVRMGAAVVMIKDSTGGLTMATAGVPRLMSAGGALAPVAERWSDRLLWMPAYQVVEASTAGAGDAAVAGLLHGIAQRLGPEESLRCAAAAAAARVEDGGRIPRWEVLRDRVHGGWAVHDALAPAGCDVVETAGATDRRTALSGR